MTVQLFEGDCLDIMPTLEPNSVDSIITDPPYGLEFMGKEWDHGVPGVSFWEACLRVAKPGAALLAFGGTRTHHRLMCAIEDAGWEIRDCLMWLYGSGFPKSHDISKAIDKAAGAERGTTPDYRNGPNTNPMSKGDKYSGGYLNQDNGSTLDKGPSTDAAALWDGWGTALKPAYEPIILAMKPRDGTFANNALEHGVAGIWVDGCRVEGPGWQKQDRESGAGFKTDKFMGAMGRGEATQQNGYRESSKGRWPANLLLDEHAAAMLDEQSGESRSGPRYQERTANSSEMFWKGNSNTGVRDFGDTGGASRFFYCAKASRKERNLGCDDLPERERAGINKMMGNDEGGESMRTGSGNIRNNRLRNNHPTVKPLALMRWLCRLTKTPTGGVVLDPFTGSGSTGIAAVLEGRDFIGIEIERESFEIAEARIAKAQSEMVQTRMTV